MHQLLQFLNHTASMSPALTERLYRIIRQVKFKKGDVLLQEGQIASHIYYIEWGLIRSYYILNGKEVSNWFMKEGDIFISVLSFFRQIPSVDIHIALEDCVCWGISHAELEETYALHPEFNKHGRLISNEYYCRSEERHLSLKRQTPERKYELMMEKDPDLILRVTNKHMASFLNVSRRAYDDMRSEYAEKMKKKK